MELISIHVAIIPWPLAAMVWLRRNAYFRAEEWLASLAARKTQYNVHFVDIIPYSNQPLQLNYFFSSIFCITIHMAERHNRGVSLVGGGKQH